MPLSSLNHHVLPEETLPTMYDLSSEDPEDLSCYTDRLRVFTLAVDRYQEIELDASQPKLWIPALELGLGRWQGEYEGVTRHWLRWYDAQGNWIPTDTEQALQRDIKVISTFLIFCHFSSNSLPLEWAFESYLAGFYIYPVAIPETLSNTSDRA